MREDIRKWVEALESGEYKQTQRTLHNLSDGGYCCLGVYCKVNGITEDEVIGLTPDENGNIGEGPAEIYDQLRQVLGEGIVSSGIYMNDDEGESFKEIAQMVRDQVGEWE